MKPGAARNARPRLRRLESGTLEKAAAQDAVGFAVGGWPDVERWPRSVVARLHLRPEVDSIAWRQLVRLAHFVAGSPGGPASVRDFVHDVAAVSEELLRNAFAYHSSPQHEVVLTVSRHRQTVCVESKNTATAGAILELRERFDRLDCEDPDALLRGALERAARQEPESSGIGLFKLRAMFDVALGAHVEELDADHAWVRVRALLNQKDGRTS